MISETLLALGPFVVPALLIILAVLLCLVVWLLDNPSAWRVTAACLILLFITAQLAPLVLR